MSVIRNRVYDEKVASDSEWGKTYHVYLFSDNQGTCECPDFHNRGVVRGDLDYRCKHIIRAWSSYNNRQLATPRKVTTFNKTNTNGSATNRIDVLSDANGKLYLRAFSRTNLWGEEQPLAISEDEIELALAEGRAAIAREKSASKGWASVR